MKKVLELLKVFVSLLLSRQRAIVSANTKTFYIVIWEFHRAEDLKNTDSYFFGVRAFIASEDFFNFSAHE